MRKTLGRRQAPAAILCTSVALMALSLNTGLIADDYVHLFVLKGAPGVPSFARAPWDIFRFTTPETTPALQAHGILSWWADQTARLAFFRPVSALTHYLDHLLWPEQAWAMHLHNLVWGIVALAGVLALYRRLIPHGLALGLSFYLYALDDARAWFVSWVSGRNTVIATALSLWALVLYVRGRQQGCRWTGWASLLLFSLSLLAGEGSVAICAYLLSHAVWLESDRPILRRLFRLSPYVLVVIAWRVMYRAAGYGVSGSGLYADPMGEPLAFALAFVERAPLLLFSQFGGAWSELWSTLFVVPTIKLAIALQAGVSTVLYAYPFWPHVRRDRLTAFGLTGAVLSLVPASAAFPADRLLNWVAIGAAPATARLILLHLRRPGKGFYAKTAAATAVLLVLAKVIVAPPMLASRARGAAGFREMLERVDASVPSDEGVRDRTVIYMNPPAVPLAAYLPMMRGATGKPAPRAQAWLASGTGAVSVQRIGPRSLALTSTVGLLENPASRLLRDPRRPFSPGQVVRVGVLRIVVRAVDGDGMPTAFEAHFDRVLEHPSLELLAWSGTRYAPFTPPALGEAVTLPAADYFEALFGHRLAIDGRHPSATQLR
ncbi:MAG: hypothetical protein OXR73_03950 [Myxococcales bacterium]|nr:hypothetical protein [Myxococcales bacterium]